MQLDEAGRGFSFRLDGPLDMRMSGEGPSAADVVARASERDLADIIFQLGEERHSRAVARAIAAARKDAPIAGTRALADIVERVVHSRPGQIHPATRTFQALRIHVNRELDDLETGLAAAHARLRPGGRLAIISFHSLEDRAVKRYIAAHAKPPAGNRRLPVQQAFHPTLRTIGDAVLPDEAEIGRNPRARSAVLRVAEKVAADARDAGAGGRA
jgi:16S rRNA (cytosine1402-N4)-methyltransferase